VRVSCDLATCSACEGGGPRCGFTRCQPELSSEAGAPLFSVLPIGPLHFGAMHSCQLEQQQCCTVTVQLGSMGDGSALSGTAAWEPGAGEQLQQLQAVEAGQLLQLQLAQDALEQLALEEVAGGWWGYPGAAPAACRRLSASAGLSSCWG
jgi:hypothetical protein